MSTCSGFDSALELFNLNMQVLECRIILRVTMLQSGACPFRMKHFVAHLFTLYRDLELAMTLCDVVDLGDKFVV